MIEATQVATSAYQRETVMDRDRARIFALIIAAIALIGGVLLLATPVSTVTAGDRAVACGTAFTPDTSQAEQDHLTQSLTYAMETGRVLSAGANPLDGYAARCDDAVSTRRGWGYGLGILGLIVGLGAIVVGTKREPGHDKTAPASPVTDTGEAGA